MAGHIATSQSIDWNTPKHILDLVREFYGGVIDLDPCSNQNSIVDAKTSYILPHNDGLKDPWKGNVFINPPFGRCIYDPVKPEFITAKQYKKLPKEEQKRFNKTSIIDWVKKAIREVEFKNKGNQAILLIPAAVDTKHFQDYIFPVIDCGIGSICFIKGRIKFLSEGREREAAPMACCLFYIGNSKNREHFMDVFSNLGYCIC